MAVPQDLKRVYYHIIDDVVAKMKPEFVQESVDESVLHTIRQRWAQKLIERGIIVEGDGQEDVAAKKEGSGLAAASRKRQHDGSGPSTKQDVVSVANNESIMYSTPAGKVQAAAAARTAAAAPQQRPQLPVGMQLPQGVQAVPGPRMPASMPANIQQLQQLQQLAGVQQLHTLQALQAQGVHPHIMQQLIQQQNLQRAAMPQAHQQAVAQALQQQALQQQQQQMQQMQMQQRPMADAMQQQLQQALQQGMGIPGAATVLQHTRVIPQQDGSSDHPPTLSEVAAAGGMQPAQLRSMLHPRIAAVLERGEQAGSSSSSIVGQQPATATAAQASSSVSPLLGASAATAAFSSSMLAHKHSSRAGKQWQQQRHLQHQRAIPQVDGNGDDYNDGEGEEDYAGDDGADDEVPEDEEDQEADQDDDDVDEDIAKLDNDLDAQEEADKEDIQNVGFTLFEKVHRSKNRWRCNLRFGVFLINGKEYLFNKGTTDLMF